MFSARVCQADGKTPSFQPTVEVRQQGGRTALEIDGIFWKKQLFKDHHTEAEWEAQKDLPLEVVDGEEGWTLDDDGRPFPRGAKRLYKEQKTFAEKRGKVETGAGEAGALRHEADTDRVGDRQNFHKNF